MKIFLSNIIQSIFQYSQKLDNLTLLCNQNWVVLSEIDKIKLVYIFRSNGELLISRNGMVVRGKWEFLGSNSLMVEESGCLYLFKHGFFDENVLALKKDGVEDYAVFINEHKFGTEINNIDDVIKFLTVKYIRQPEMNVGNKVESKKKRFLVKYDTDCGEIIVDQEFDRGSPEKNEMVFQNDLPARDGKYKMGFMWYIYVKDGRVVKTTLV